MSDTFVADDKLATALGHATGPLTVLGADGTVLGYASPARPTLGFVKVPFSEEEILRRMSDPGVKWIPAADVEAKVRELKCTR